MRTFIDRTAYYKVGLVACSNIKNELEQDMRKIVDIVDVQ